MARAQAIGYQVRQILNKIKGIGTSKKVARAKSSKIAENGQKVSPLVHSYKSLENLRIDLTNLGKFAKQEFGVKELKDIDIHIVKEWLNSKNINYRTASNYLSNINKVQDFLSLNGKEIKELRQELKEKLEKPVLETRAYTKLDKIQSNLKNEKSQISYRLQIEYGLRAKEALHINLNRQLKENTLFVQGKGGKIVEKELDKGLIALIQKNAKNGVYELNYKTYTRDLKQAIEKTGQKYNGTHGLRHSYAQKLLEQGYTKQEVSQEMGHNREEITDVYLR